MSSIQTNSTNAAIHIQVCVGIGFRSPYFQTSFRFIELEQSQDILHGPLYWNGQINLAISRLEIWNMNKRGVKMAGSWPISFLLSFACLWQRNSQGPCTSNLLKKMDKAKFRTSWLNNIGQSPVITPGPNQSARTGSLHELLVNINKLKHYRRHGYFHQYIHYTIFIYSSAWNFIG